MVVRCLCSGCFRLVRPFRVIRKQNELLHVLDALIVRVPSVLVFYVALIALFALAGMKLFGGKFPVTLRSHFNTFGDAMLTLFKIACGGNVWGSFYAALQASGFAVATLCFIAYFVLGVLVTLNFLLVVLLKNFAMKESAKTQTLRDLFQHRLLVM